MDEREIGSRIKLEKNKEGEITETETIKLEAYISKVDQALETSANDLLKLAEHRQEKENAK